MDGSGDSSVQVSLESAQGVSLLHVPHRDKATMVAWQDGPLRCTWHKGKVEGQRTGEVGEKQLGQSSEEGSAGRAAGDEREQPALPTAALAWLQ